MILTEFTKSESTGKLLNTAHTGTAIHKKKKGCGKSTRSLKTDQEILARKWLKLQKCNEEI